MADDEQPVVDEPKEQDTQPAPPDEDKPSDEPPKDDSSKDEPQEEETKESEEEVETPEKEEPQPEEKPKEDKPSRRESLRIQQLIARHNRETRKEEQPKGLDYKEALDADPEVIERLEADRKAASESSYNQGLEQAKTIQFHTRLEVDAPRVEDKYKFLNPRDKENFDSVRADAMNSLYLQSVGYDPGDPSKGIPESVQNPNIRYADFVEAQMEFAEALMAEKSQRSSENIAKQVAQTGLRPDGSASKGLNLDPNRDPGEMSDEELDAMINRTMPKR